ncbi:MAG TPA: isochorismatase family protein [Candidatus Binatia bacterium]|nr:isochorismatase family protein [Candidatus Binatia bacterium]
MATVLITQCLQRDFVDPIGPQDPLPNLLHVGYAEATRLLGPDPPVGPLAQLIEWAHGLPEEQIDIVHIRDWHDPDDPTQHDHLRQFGAHCIQGSTGARLVLGMDERAGTARNEKVINSLTLSDLEGTDLAEHLERIRQRSRSGRLRVGVVGVWTEAKVSFLLYDLKTRLGIDELATCSALTASASRAQHFNAMAQLERILGVRCFESLADFVDWLHPGAELHLPHHPPGFEPRITVSGGATVLDTGDRAIVAHLFRDSTEVDLASLTGGYSGALVWRATSHDALGHRQAPSVVKVGPNRAIAQERVAFERVEAVLGNNAPRVRGFVDVGERAGLKYSYAAMGQGRVRTLQSMFAANVATDRLVSVVRATFAEVLHPLYAAAQYERMPLLEHYGFSTSLAPSVREHVSALAGDADRDVLEFPDGLARPNVCTFYEEVLARQGLPAQDYHYVAYVHGDLNAANILVDSHHNVWVIDYFHAGPGHVLKDLAKFENDLLYLLTPIENDAQLVEALAVTRALQSVRDLKAPLRERPDEVHSAELVRAWEMLRVLRRIDGQLCHEDRDPLQLQVALLRYAVHTLGFPEASPLQKRWALAAACSFSDQITRTIDADSALRVDWIESSLVPRGRLGITVCPGRRDRGRDLETDLRRLRSDGATTLLCLLTDAELQWAGVAELGARAKAAGLDYLRLPIPDQGIPEVDEAVALVNWISEATERGASVVLACMGGLGRSGTVAACFLVSSGATAEEAIAAVRAARGPRALETVAQEDFVVEFAASARRIAEP